MRRLFAILLLVLMPLQVGWAVASAYCQHEGGAAARHFGHHEHQHHADVPDHEAGKSFGTDPDCSACHAGGAFAVPHLNGLAELPLAVAPPPAFSLPPLPERASAPERPDWSVPA